LRVAEEVQRISNVEVFLSLVINRNSEQVGQTRSAKFAVVKVQPGLAA